MAQKNSGLTAEGWPVGVLFSRAGVSAATGSEHFFGTVLAIEEINAAGGVAGRPIVPVAYDPRGQVEQYRRLAARMLLEDDVNVIFGCSTSSSRKAVLPVIERTNGLLWYCSVYEGFEYSPNVIYTGAVPNQNSVQLAAYLLRHGKSRFYLIGDDYIFPRESNRVMRDIVEQHGGEIVGETYVDSDTDTAALAGALKSVKEAQSDVVFSTLVGTHARAFYKLYGESGIDLREIPIASLTMTEGEIHLIGPALCRGHVAAATYFNSLENERNRVFKRRWHERFPAVPPSMWSEMAYNQCQLFARALALAETLDTEKLVQAAYQIAFDSPEGTLQIDAENNHCMLTPRIGVCNAEGGFDVVWEEPGPVKPDPYLKTYGYADLRLA